MATTGAETVDLDVEGIIVGIWNQRGNGPFLHNAIELISEFLLDRDVFDQIEFFLPQLGHMIIHLTGDETVMLALDRLAVILCQASLHVAIKLTFILNAAMEDYSEESSSGLKNPTGNGSLYKRCARLLYTVERAVIYGHPVVKQGIGISRSMSGCYEETGFREFANLIVGDEKDDGPTLSGKLLYKRNTRAHVLQRKAWKERWFKVDHRVLYCYHDSSHSTLRRSISLKDCIINSDAKSSHKHYFELRECSTGTVFQLRAISEEESVIWLDALKKASTGIPTPVVAMAKVPSEDSLASPADAVEMEPSVPQSPLDENIVSRTESASDASYLTPHQRNRLSFFNDELQFVRTLTDICERLRFIERERRRESLEEEQRLITIPSGRVYLPLCKSTDPWRAVLKPLPSEGHAFTTKARCPALMLFELEQHPTDMDVASYLFTDLSVEDSLMVSIPEDLTIKQTTEVSASPVRPVSLFRRGVSDRNMESSETTSKDSILRGSIFHVGVKRLSVVSLAENRDVYQAAVEISKMTAEGDAAERERTERACMSISSPPLDDSGVVSGLDQNDILLKESAAIAAEAEVATAGDTKEETAAWTMGTESFQEKTERLYKASTFSSLKNWKLDGLIAKSNDDLRQEVFVIQLITFFNNLFRDAEVDVLLYSYQIMSTSKSTGLIQLIPDAISIDALKKQPSWPGSLRGHFELAYGAPGSPAFETAMNNYVRSMAGYSIVAYLLAIKDRHNGNIMIHRSGQLIHIDFGFVFGLAPGKKFSMEKAPWKLTVEMVEAMGGRESEHYNRYLQLCADAFRVARRNGPKIISLMEIMSHQSNYPAFRYNSDAIEDFRRRLHAKYSDERLPVLIRKLANKSYDHIGTGNYDSFQVLTNGIAK